MSSDAGRHVQQTRMMIAPLMVSEERGQYKKVHVKYEERSRLHAHHSKKEQLSSFACGPPRGDYVHIV
jgi:hypothetical protein